MANKSPETKFIEFQTSLISMGLIASAVLFSYIGFVVNDAIRDTPSLVVSALEREHQELRTELRSIDVEQAEILDQRVRTLISALESSSEALLRVDGAGTVQSASVGALEFLGVTRAQIIGFGLSDFIPKEMREAHTVGFRSLMDGKGGLQSYRRVVECDLTIGDTVVPVSLQIWATPGVSAIARITPRELEVVVK